jgi:predicted amidophosphoribosyltransferase
MSRLTLQWFDLTQREGQDLCLKIPICDVYAPIIDRAFPELNHIGWRPGTQGTCFTYIKRITSEDYDSLRDFLELLGELRCLTLTDHLAPHFQAELDEAYALDFNFQTGVFPFAYTDVGNLEHIAKEQQNSAAVAQLSARLAEVIRRHPSFSRVDIVAPMPPRPSKAFHLPVEMARVIGTTLGCSVGLNLTKAEHPKLRTLPMQQKLSALAGAFSLDGAVDGKSVLIIDDLYQSGASAWSLARFLKSRGALQVYGLACVKSWRDTDNQ